MKVSSILAILSTLSLQVYAAAVERRATGVVGSPVGFAYGTTGGGNATPQTPSSPAQLKSWLEDDVARVIVLDRTYDFTGTEGVCTNCDGCIPDSYKCGSKGQLAIRISGQTWCNGLQPTTVTYDKAAITPIAVKSNKSLVGSGAKGIIKGKGLRMANGVSNIIVQNIHITNLNPQYIWGGDAITLVGTNKVWIDHVKISLIGRQMFVTGYDSAGAVTVSNCEFDGQTSWSSSCDGRHYWSVLGYGANDLITFTNNYIHHTSGRSPKMEGNNVWHAVGNYWYSNTGHAFDVGQDSQTLIEGNVFEDVKTTLQGNLGQVFAPTSANVGTCSANLGRSCQPNAYTNSPAIDGTQTGFLANMKGRNIAPATPIGNVKSNVLANAGFGKI